MNNLLLILGLLALSNGNTSLFGNKDKNVSNDSLKIDKKDNKKLVPKVKQNSKSHQSQKSTSSSNLRGKKIKKIKNQLIIKLLNSKKILLSFDNRISIHIII